MFLFHSQPSALLSETYKYVYSNISDCMKMKYHQIKIEILSKWNKIVFLIFIKWNIVQNIRIINQSNFHHYTEKRNVTWLLVMEEIPRVSPGICDRVLPRDVWLHIEE